MSTFNLQYNCFNSDDLEYNLLVLNVKKEKQQNDGIQQHVTYNDYFKKETENTQKYIQNQKLIDELYKYLNFKNISLKPSRNEIGPLKTDYDKYIYNNFSIDDLTQDKNQWKIIINNIERKYSDNLLLIKRIKQIRRRELQKKYNKELRLRKKK